MLPSKRDSIVLRDMLCVSGLVRDTAESFNWLPAH